MFNCLKFHSQLNMKVFSLLHLGMFLCSNSYYQERWNLFHLDCIFYFHIPPFQLVMRFNFLCLLNYSCVVRHYKFIVVLDAHPLNLKMRPLHNIGMFIFPNSWYSYLNMFHYQCYHCFSCLHITTSYLGI